MDINYFTKPSKIYSFLKKYVDFSFGIFYNELHVTGTENIPEKLPVIFAPNHQNALMDALAIITQTKRQPVFLAKADIFESKILAQFLNTLKILPVYRIRDGYENLGNNDQSFEIIKNCLLTNNCVGIMPEGTQTELQQLQPLKKGIARLALNAQDLLGDKTGIQIIPVGIHYSNFYFFRSNIHISFGKPIDVRQFIDNYKVNPQKAFNEVKDLLAIRLKEVMVSIENKDYYELIKDCKDIAATGIMSDENKPISFSDRFAAEKLISDCLSNTLPQNKEATDELANYVSEFKNTSKRLEISPEVFDNKYPANQQVFDFVRFAFFMPVAIAGALTNALPAYIAYALSKKADDQQFASSIKFGVGAALYPLYYLIFLLLPLPIVFKGLFLLTMPLAGILAYDYFRGLRIFMSSIKLNNGLNKNDPAISRWIYTRSQIIKRIKSCLEQS